MKALHWAAIVVACAWAFAASAAPVVVSSCDGRYQLQEDGTGHVLLQTPAGRRIRLSTGHGLAGGAIDVAHRQFVIYGLPSVPDRRSPQAMLISVYADLDRQPRRLLRTSTGAGIYSAGYTVDGRSIVVEYAYGSFLIDTLRRRTGSLLPPDRTPTPVADCGAWSPAGRS